MVAKPIICTIVKKWKNICNYWRTGSSFVSDITKKYYRFHYTVYEYYRKYYNNDYS